MSRQTIKEPTQAQENLDEESEDERRHGKRQVVTDVVQSAECEWGSTRIIRKKLFITYELYLNLNTI